MVPRTAGRWMWMGMRLMRVMDVVVGVVQTVRVRAVDIVMRVVKAVMGIVDVLVGIVTQERIGEPIRYAIERFRVSLITLIPDRNAAGGYVIAGRAPLWRAPEFPRRWRVQGWRRRWRRRFPNLYSGHGAVARYSTTLPRRRLALEKYHVLHHLFSLACSAV